MHSHFFVRVLFLLGIGQAVLPTAIAQFWGARKPAPFSTLPQSLKQGEFTWAPELAPAGPILVVVSLSEQIGYTYRNGIMIGACKVSTGKPGHETPTGIFYTKYKDADHRSSKYNNAAMPYTQMLTSTGVALHAGGLPGYPSSHGCIHLPSEYARLLYQAAPKGMTVVISRDGRSPEMVAHPSFISPVLPEGSQAPVKPLTSAETFRWAPDTSLRGPISIIISRIDQRAIVMQDGKEQGRCKVEISYPDSALGTHVLVAAEDHRLEAKVDQAAGLQQLPRIQLDRVLPEDRNRSWSQEMMWLTRIKVPAAFLQVVYRMVVPGTTLVLTDAPVLTSTTGVNLTLLTDKSPKKARK